MELLGIAVIILILAIITATISALRKDGLGHNPPVRSEEYWMARDLPSVNYTLRIFLTPTRTHTAPPSPPTPPQIHPGPATQPGPRHAPGPASEPAHPRKQPAPVDCLQP